MQTLSELIECFHLYGVCEPCDRMEQIDLQKLVEHYGPNYPVQEIRKRVRCDGCGQRTENLRIVYVGPEGRAATFRYTR